MRKNFGAKTYLYPQPVMIISTYNEDGTPNAMNAAWGGICGVDKIIIEMSEHKTTENILKTRAFTVAVADKHKRVEHIRLKSTIFSTLARFSPCNMSYITSSKKHAIALKLKFLRCKAVCAQ